MDLGRLLFGRLHKLKMKWLRSPPGRVCPLAVQADPLNALEGLGLGLRAKEFLHMLMEWPGRFESEVDVILPGLAIIG